MKVALFSRPCPSTAAIRDPVLTMDERGLSVSLVCDDDGQERPSTVRFIRSRALRKREQIYCKTWHIEDAYDTVCEVIDSEWVAELRRDSVPEWRDYWLMRHFVLYLDSFGCLQVVAESACLAD